MHPSNTSTNQASDEQVAAVERCITRLLDDFTRHPYAHRVEHSLHVDLYQSLLHEPAFGRMVQIGTSPYRTRLVHKEWPSTKAVTLRDSALRRQNYDIAVLDPDALVGASLKDFAAGRIPAHIVIELGLDYDLKHLEGDIQKLKANEVERGYLVHLSRKRSSLSSQVEDRVRNLTGARVAFAHLDPTRGVFRSKGLGDAEITERAYE